MHKITILPLDLGYEYYNNLFGNYEKERSFMNNYRDPSNQADNVLKQYLFRDSAFTQNILLFFVALVLKNTKHFYCEQTYLILNNYRNPSNQASKILEPYPFRNSVCSKTIFEF